MTSINTLRTNVWDNINYYFETKDETPAVPLSTTNIHGSFNSKQIATEGYPKVIIYPPSCSVEKVTANGKIVMSEVSVLIELYTRTQASVKALADEVTARLLDGRTYFAGNRLMNMNMDRCSYYPKNLLFLSTVYVSQ